MANGKGTLTWPDGIKYVGEFVNDNREGRGVQTWPNGSKYAGQWRADKKHGKGELVT